MHICKECNKKASGSHEQHTEMLLFLSFNMRCVLKKKYPHIYLMPQIYIRQKLMDKIEKEYEIH